MPKISYAEYLNLARDPETDDDVLLSFSLVKRGEGGFDFSIKPDPEKVEMLAEDIEFENALQIGNGLARFRRQMRFRRRKLFGSNLPILVSEGDSWFQFPLLVDEVVDQLEDDYLIWSVGAAGDTAKNIVFGRSEYLNALNRHDDEVQGFLFSAAGNDIIGEDPDTQEAVLLALLKDFNGNEDDIEGHINLDLLEQKMRFLEDAYNKVINDIRTNPKFETLPIIIHGYDYVFPYPWGQNDPRDPVHADKNEWLGAPLDQRQIQNQQQRRNIIKFLIDRLYEMLDGISGSSEVSGVWVVDCRGAMPAVEDWIDEIHGTSDGFKKVAVRFRSVLSQVI